MATALVLSQSRWPRRMEHTHWPGPGHVTILYGTWELLAVCQGWRQCDAPRARPGVQSRCPCAQSPGTCFHTSSRCTTLSPADKMFMIPLFPSQALFHIQGSKGSCFKIVLDILCSPVRIIDSVKNHPRAPTHAAPCLQDSSLF